MTTRRADHARGGRRPRAGALALLAALAACGGDAAGGAEGQGGGAGEPGPREVTLAERWVSPTDTLWNIDTPALWMGAGEARVLATGKDSHDLKVFDAATGAALPAIGRMGAALGEFQRPNAVLVVGDLAFTVERDNRRVQVTRMPGGEPAGAFGGDVLVKPYGAVISGALPDLTFWVTDDYEVPPDGTGDLTRRIHRFRVAFDAAGAPTVREHAAFGEASGPGALQVVETIGLDEAHNRLLVADEARRAHLIYDTTGVFTGGAMGEGLIAGDPEGVALVRCADATGYWIATDQQPDVSWFRIFRRDDLAYLGAFRGQVTTNTDGVTFAHGVVPGFDGPAFFAVHDDQGVTAFAWDEVAQALGLTQGCGR